MSAIRLANVWKFYGDVQAVRDLTLSCADGEMLALLGPSGCGKSSTLKMIAGIETLSRGEIFFDDRPVSALAPGERNIAMVFEDYALYPHLSVFENIAFPLKIRHLRPREIEARAGKAIDLLGLHPVRAQNVKSLSGGAQQRVSIGRALVRDPELILFDEPLSHLDADQKVQLRSEIKRLQRTSGLTAVLVTHDQTEAVAMSDRVAVMNHGVLQQVGAPEELYHAPANLFVANFIGEPPMNLLPAELTDAGGALALAGDGWKIPVEGELAVRLRGRAGARGVVLGVRPEHVDVRPGAPRTDAGSDTWMPATVFFREPRGDVDVLTLALDGARGASQREPDPDGGLITAETPGPTRIERGAPVAIRIPPDRVAVFDAEGGGNLLRP
ncbi:MAG: ABC transporter ATP-binding protein [Kiloniellaceae bacterium]